METAASCIPGRNYTTREGMKKAKTPRARRLAQSAALRLEFGHYEGERPIRERDGAIIWGRMYSDPERGEGEESRSGLRRITLGAGGGAGVRH